MQHVFGGIDVPKHRFWLCLTDDAGSIVLQLFIESSERV